MSLYLIRGLPGSGKSTFASTLFMNGMVQQIVEADDFFIQSDGSYVFDAKQLCKAHSICRSKVQQYLQEGYSVAVSNTSTTESEVAVYQNLATRFDTPFISIIMENRHGSSSIHNVPQSTMTHMKRRFSIKL